MNENNFNDQDGFSPENAMPDDTHISENVLQNDAELDMQALIAQTVSEITGDSENASADVFINIDDIGDNTGTETDIILENIEDDFLSNESQSNDISVESNEQATDYVAPEIVWNLSPEDEEPISSEPEVQQAPPPIPKGRPKRKKGEGLFGIPNILVTLVWLAIALLIGTTLGRMLWLSAAEVLAFGREDRVVTVTVYESDSIEQIIEKLYNAGLIRYPKLFKLYADFAVDDGEIHPGIWDLNTKYDYHALVKMMAPSSSRQTVTVMIPEGYSCRQIFSLLEENKVCTAQDIAGYAAYGELNDYWFLEGLERGDKYCLEGFLFPDTYEFYQNDSPKNIIHKMLDNFNNRFSEEMIWQIDQLNGQLADIMRSNGHGDDYIAAHTLSVRDIVIVASMIEKETAGQAENKLIASVIYNRLYNWGSIPAYLNIDATIIYALDGKTDLTSEDLRIDSPYNTYTNIGLTPGPISNPGLGTIQAALEPGQSDYYFYVLDTAAGAHHFSRTQEEHDAFRATLGG